MIDYAPATPMKSIDEFWRSAFDRRQIGDDFVGYVNMCRRHRSGVERRNYAADVLHDENAYLSGQRDQCQLAMIVLADALNELHDVSDTLVTYAETHPDPRTDGAADCVLVTLRDFDALRQLLFNRYTSTKV